jgi:hypothetical protein
MAALNTTANPIYRCDTGDGTPVWDVTLMSQREGERYAELTGTRLLCAWTDDDGPHTEVVADYTELTAFFEDELDSPD